MKVELTNIYHGRSTKRFSIFSIDHKDDYIATGSINGEMKIYYKEKAQTYKNHKNAVLCVRFDPYSDSLASGSDDNAIIVYKKTNSVYKKVASFETHTSDVSCICWHKSFLVSAGYDGQIFLYEKETFNVIRKVKAFDICYGVIANNDHLICQSDKEIRVYDFSLNLIKTVDTLFCGNIVEAFFARNSFNFGCKYLAVCLAHNNKANSVEVLNDSYEQQFSLIGHVAPIESVSFFPNMLCKDDKYYNLIAVGSQDKSISFWISDNPNPFLLLKNAFEQPILDMFWKGYVLYVASYDGTVKTFTFSDEEIGREVFYIENFEEFDDIPLIVENENKKMPESSISMSKESNAKKPDEIKLQDEKVSICMDKQLIKKSKKNRPEKQNPIAKRIKPVLVSQAQPDDIIKPLENQDILYIFPSGNERFTKIKRKASIERIDLRIAEFEISVISKEKSTLTVLRAGKVFYTHSFEKIYLFKANRNYIAMVIKDSTFDSLLTYQLETGLMHLPAISMQSIAFIDLLKHSLLIALGDSTIQIINLKTKKCTVEAKLPITDNLKSIVLHDKYNIIALYDFGSYIYHYKTKLWFKKNKNFSTVMYKSTDMNFDESDEVDETFDELEYNFRIYELLEDKCKMIAIAEKMVKYSLNLKTFDEIVYNKFLYVFKSLKSNGENRKTVLLLEMMNSNCILQPAVFEMANFFKSQSK